MDIGPEPSLGEWRELTNAALEFKALACWDWMYDADMFGVKDPESGEIGYCCVLGRAGQAFGLVVYLGAEGLAGARRLLDSEVDLEDDDLVYAMKSLVMTFEDRDALTRKDLQIVKALGLRLRGPKAWPQFRSYMPGYMPWYFSAAEARFVTQALRQTMDVAKRFRMDENLLTSEDPEQFLVRVARPDGDHLSWKDEYLAPDPSPPKTHRLALDESRLQRVRDSLPRRRDVWEVDFFFIPMAVKEEGRPYFPMNCLWLDHRTGLLLGTSLGGPEDYARVFPNAFLETLERLKFLPAAVQFQRDAAMNLFEPILRALGIAAVRVRSLPAFELAKGEFLSLILSREGRGRLDGN